MVMEIVVSVILLFVNIAVLVTIHVCIVGRAFRRGGGFDFNGANTVVQRSGTSRSPNMSSEDIRKLPYLEYKLEEEMREKSSPMECAVCLGNFKVGEMCRFLPNCKHSFHSQCIDSWLSKTAVCPICRTTANPPEVGEQSRNSGEVGVEIDGVV